MISLNWLA